MDSAGGEGPGEKNRKVRVKPVRCAGGDGSPAGKTRGSSASTRPQL